MRQQSHRISAVDRLPEILPYCEPDDSPWAPRIEPLLLCAPTLAWLTMTVTVFTLGMPDGWRELMIPLLWVPTPFCCLYALCRYRHERKTWHVVVCLTVNAVGFALTGTPLLLLWGWTLLVVLAQ